jgi:hypothetical protein
MKLIDTAHNTLPQRDTKMLRLVARCVNTVTIFANYNIVQERIFKWQIVITIVEAAAPAAVNGRIRPLSKSRPIKKVILKKS